MHGKLIPAEMFAGNMTGANQVLYDRLIDALLDAQLCSVRRFERETIDSVFCPLRRFDGLKESHIGEWVGRGCQPGRGTERAIP